MKITIRLPILLITAALLMVGCSVIQQDAPPAEPAIAEAPTCEPVLPQVDAAPLFDPGAPVFDAAAQYHVHLLEDSANKEVIDVYFQDAASKEMLHIASLENVNTSHYHHTEYQNGSLYILLRTGDDMTDNWSDELWRYTGYGEASLLYSAKGIDFRVAPGEGHIAIRGENNLLVLDPQGGLLQEFTPEQILPPGGMMDIGLVDWSADGSALWLETGGPAMNAFSRLRVPSWEIGQFDVSGLSMGKADYALNPDSGKLAFSDYPMFFEVYSAQEFQASQADVTLSVIDLQTQAIQVIAVSKAQQFRPVWLDAATLEYMNPADGSRITIVVP
jgi:hypothetical protein